MNKKPIFDVVRTMLGRSFTQSEVAVLDRTIDMADSGLPASQHPGPVPAPTPAPSPARHALGTAGSGLIKKWEGCARRLANGTFAAYPDPGSIDGKPWTIGWGSTGVDIAKGTIWTQAQCDRRFEVDVRRYVDEVASFLGTAPTTPNQFDAMVSFHYNTGKIRSATLGRLHRQGSFAAAQAEFGKWIFNDGKPMNGLRSRRADEAALYAMP